MIALWIEMLAITFASKPRPRTRRHPTSLFSLDDPAAPTPPAFAQPRTIDITPQPRQKNVSLQLGLLLLVLFGLVYIFVLHPWFMNWGATAEEQRMALPGDDLMLSGQDNFTRAITIQAPPSVVWQWIVQMGQERGGFYSNTWLENLTGANIHNSDVLHPEWRNRHIGDVVLLARDDLFGGAFAEVARTRIVGMEQERWIAFIPTRFVLQPIGKNATRLLLREPLPDSWTTRFLIALIWDPMHCVMEERMLRGIKERAEASPLVDHMFMIAAQVGWIAFGFALFVFFLVEPGRIAWIVVPLLWAVPVLIFTSDWQASLAAFEASGVALGGALAFGVRWSVGFLLVAAFVLCVMLLASEPYLVLGGFLGVAALISATTF